MDRDNEIYKYPKHKSPIEHYPYDYPAFNRVVKNEENIEDLFLNYKYFSSAQREDFITLFDNTHLSEYNSRLITEDNINDMIKLVITNSCVTINNNSKHDHKSIKSRYTIYDNIYCIILIRDEKIIGLYIPIIASDSYSDSEPIIKFI